VTGKARNRRLSGTAPARVRPLWVGIQALTIEQEFCKLLIRRPDRSPDKYLVALRATADHYGWAQQFPTWTPRTSIGVDGTPYVIDPGRRGELRRCGGVGMMVSRKPPGKGSEKGFVHRFQISQSCSLFDIAEIAHFTQGDWYWMSGPRGGRISRDAWERRYQTGFGLHRRQEEGGMFR